MTLTAMTVLMLRAPTPTVMKMMRTTEMGFIYITEALSRSVPIVLPTCPHIKQLAGQIPHLRMCNCVTRQ